MVELSPSGIRSGGLPFYDYDTSDAGDVTGLIYRAQSKYSENDLF